VGELEGGKVQRTPNVIPIMCCTLATEDIYKAFGADETALNYKYKMASSLFFIYFFKIRIHTMHNSVHRLFQK